MTGAGTNVCEVAAGGLVAWELPGEGRVAYADGEGDWVACAFGVHGDAPSFWDHPK